MKKQWSKKYKKCLKCKTTENKHYAFGMCNICYGRNRWKTKPNYRENIKRLSYEWREKHPERWKVIQSKAIKKYMEKKKVTE